MTLWCDVYNAAGTKQNTRPVLLMGASYTRMLDGAGSFTLEAPLTDDTAVTYLQSQRRVVIYTDVPKLRLVGAGIIARLSKKMGAGGWTLTADGPDLLHELKYVNTLLNRQFNAAYALDALDELVGLVTGWRLEAEPDETGITARFDGTSVLKAMQSICEQTGLHFRYKDNRVVQAGYFGADSGVTLINPDSANADSEHTALIDSLSVLEESEDICNWVIPLGSGEGEAALTLQNTSAGFPYPTAPVQFEITGSDGQTQYYIKDDESIALYGERQKVVKFDVLPLDNSGNQKVLAANQLHAAATEYLAKNSMPQITYGMSARGLQKTVLPGDRIRLLYFGPIRREDSTIVPDEQIDQMLYVIKVVERHGADGVTWNFEVSNIDRKLPTEADIVQNEIEKAQVRNTKPGLTPSVFVYSMSDVYSHQKFGWLVLPNDETITKVISVKLRLRTSPCYNMSVFSWNAGSANIFGYFLPTQGTGRYPLITLDYFGGYAGQTRIAAGVGSRTESFTVEYDVTDYIVNGTAQESGHVFIVTDVVQTLSPAELALFTPASIQPMGVPTEASGGVIYATFTVLAVCQAIRG